MWRLCPGTEPTRQTRTERQECAIGTLKQGQHTRNAGERRQVPPDWQMLPEGDEGCCTGDKRSIRLPEVEARHGFFARQIWSGRGTGCADIDPVERVRTLEAPIMRDLPPTKWAGAVEIDAGAGVVRWGCHACCYVPRSKTDCYHRERSQMPLVVRIVADIGSSQ